MIVDVVFVLAGPRWSRRIPRRYRRTTRKRRTQGSRTIKVRARLTDLTASVISLPLIFTL